MEILELVQTVSVAVAEAKTKADAALKAQQHLEAVKADAKKKYDAAVEKAQEAADSASAASRDANVAGQRVKAELNEALGGLFAPVDTRVRIG